MSTTTEPAIEEEKPLTLAEAVRKKNPYANAKVCKAIEKRVLKQQAKHLDINASRFASHTEQQLRNAATIEALNLHRAALLVAMAEKKIAPDLAALDRWTIATWFAVCRLISEAIFPGEACYVYNFVYRWPCDPIMRAVVDATLAKRVAELPSDAERLLSIGIEIEGITKLT